MRRSRQLGVFGYQSRKQAYNGQISKKGNGKIMDIIKIFDNIGKRKNTAIIYLAVADKKKKKKFLEIIEFLFDEDPTFDELETLLCNLQGDDDD